MKNNEDYWEVLEVVPGRTVNAEAGCLRLQSRRIQLNVSPKTKRRGADDLACGATSRPPADCQINDQLAQFHIAMLQRVGARRLLLALISSGLTIIYGTLGVLNLAHGAMFMLGGYAGWLAYSYTSSFAVAVFAGPSSSCS